MTCPEVELELIAYHFGVIAPEVCEDAWTAECPMRRRTYSSVPGPK